MKNIKEYIESGILEVYVLGGTTAEETREVESIAAAHEEIRKEIEAIRETVEAYAVSNAAPVNPTLKPFLMAMISYTERIRNGEVPVNPPLLDQNSHIEDYAAWLNREDFRMPEDFQDIHASIIAYAPEAVTAIVWIKEMAPQEVHDDQHERFLIVEGSCNIIVEEKIYSLKAGDYFAIPLHKSHKVEVTSDIPCKAILQRVAA